MPPGRRARSFINHGPRGMYRRRIFSGVLITIILILGVLLLGYMSFIPIIPAVIYAFAFFTIFLSVKLYRVTPILLGTLLIIFSTYWVLYW